MYSTHLLNSYDDFVPHWNWSYLQILPAPAPEKRPLRQKKKNCRKIYIFRKAGICKPTEDNSAHPGGGGDPGCIQVHQHLHIYEYVYEHVNVNDYMNMSM